MCTADKADLVIKVLGVLGGAVLFLWALWQWRESQRWKRAERLDGLITLFESSPLLRLATHALDWNERAVAFEGTQVKWNSACVLDALRVHKEYDDVTYPEPQALLRDAFDALLGFLARLETAIQGGLVDQRVAVGYFQYWLKRMHSMEEHADRDPAAAERMGRYEREYGDASLLNRLYVRGGLAPRPEFVARKPGPPPLCKPD